MVNFFIQDCLSHMYVTFLVSMMGMEGGTMGSPGGCWEGGCSMRLVTSLYFWSGATC